MSAVRIIFSACTHVQNFTWTDEEFCPAPKSQWQTTGQKPDKSLNKTDIYSNNITKTGLMSSFPPLFSTWKNTYKSHTHIHTPPYTHIHQTNVFSATHLAQNERQTFSACQPLSTLWCTHHYLVQKVQLFYSLILYFSTTLSFNLLLVSSFFFKKQHVHLEV